MSAIDEVVADIRERLHRREAQTARMIARSHQQILRSVRSELRAVTAMIRSAQASGADVDPMWLIDEVRYQAMLDQLTRAYDEWTRTIEGPIRTDIDWAAARGPGDATRLIRTVTGPTSLPAIEAIQAAALAPSSPLGPLLRQLGVRARGTVEDLLIDGVARGRNPNAVADDIVLRLHADTARARTIARTEMLRAHRTSSLGTYQQHRDIVDGWRWLSARSSRTCAACWAMDGTVFSVDEPMGTHPNCRCVMVPVVTDITSGWSTGPEAFAKLKAARQDEVLGAAGGRAYRAGAVTLVDFVAVRRSPQWGTTRTTRGLAAAIGPERAARYYRHT